MSTFRHPKRKLAIAREQIELLRKEDQNFFTADAFLHVVDFNKLDGRNYYKLKLVKQLPDKVFDAIDLIVVSLRSALDKACFATSTHPNPKHTHFPIADDLLALESVVIARNCKHLHSGIIDLLRSFDPVQNGNQFLWAINRLANTDKHKCVEPYAITVNGSQIGSLNIQGGPFTFVHKWNSTTQELLLITAHPSVVIEGDFSISHFVALKEIGVLSGASAVLFLEAATNEFERIVSLIEQKAVNLGLISP